MRNLYRLKGSSLEEIRRRAEAKHGQAARIVSAELVSSPGIAGLFAGQRYEALIEVLPENVVVFGEVLPEPALLMAQADDAPAGTGTGVPHKLERSAIAALLEEADAEESRNHARTSSPVSTASKDFGVLLEELGTDFQLPTSQAQGGNEATRPDTVPRARGASRELPPALLKSAGDLVLLLGLGRDAIEAAVGMSIAYGGADVRTAGELSAYGHLHVDGRLAATAARAQAVVTGQTLLVAFGLGRLADVKARLPLIASLAADQIWLVVDAGRKPRDTAAWTKRIMDSHPVAALAVRGAGETLTPQTVNDLGIPIGWVEAAAPGQPFL